MDADETDPVGEIGAGSKLPLDDGSDSVSQKTTEIVCQPRSLSAADATNQVTGSLVRKVRNLWSDSDVIRSVLRYKPYYEFDATLRKKIFRADDEVHEGAIVVDGFTGVARPILHEQVETTVERVTTDEVLDPQIDEDSAYNRANRNRIRVQQRESGKIELAEDASLVYKPLWLVELESGDVRVVDATNGQVFGESLI